MGYGTGDLAMNLHGHRIVMITYTGNMPRSVSIRTRTRTCISDRIWFNWICSANTRLSRFAAAHRLAAHPTRDAHICICWSKTATTTDSSKPHAYDGSVGSDNCRFVYIRAEYSLREIARLPSQQPGENENRIQRNVSSLIFMDAALLAVVLTRQYYGCGMKITCALMVHLRDRLHHLCYAI